MKPVFALAKKNTKEYGTRVVFAEGEDERVLRAVQVVVDEKIARPILVGRPKVVEERIERFGLRIKNGEDFELINPDFDERYHGYWQEYLDLTERQGVTKNYARLEMRRRSTLIGGMMVRNGDADAMICGTFGNTDVHLKYIDQVIGHKADKTVYAAMNGLMLPGRQVFLVDTHINYNPTAEELAEITLMAAEEVRRLGFVPRVALLSHSNFGSSNSPSAIKMRETYNLLRQMAPELEVDGEMHGDVALDVVMRKQIMPNSTLKGEANLLVLPNIDAANIAYNLLKTSAGHNVAVGPILLGANKPVHILTSSSTVRRIVNMTALSVVQANFGSITSAE